VGVTYKVSALMVVVGWLQMCLKPRGKRQPGIPDFLPEQTNQSVSQSINLARA
jgi:hypothetical protein